MTEIYVIYPPISYPDKYKYTLNIFKTKPHDNNKACPGTKKRIFINYLIMRNTWDTTLPESKVVITKHIDAISSAKWKAKKSVKNLFSKELVIKKWDLNLSPSWNSFLCKELFEIEDNFNKNYNDPLRIKELEEDLEKYIQSAWRKVSLRKTSEQDTSSDEERMTLWKELFNSEVDNLKEATKNFTPFKKLLFWLEDYWWYYNWAFREKISMEFPEKEIMDDIAKKHLVPSLPEQVKKSVEDMRIWNLAIWYWHFAILFIDGDKRIRRIVSDTSLSELRWVYWYTYLDMAPNGKPIARSVCEEGGGRCFFDWERLMAHDKFQTCAPKTTIIDWGYKVNSTRCTIINWMLCDLIDTDDKVAYTTWAGFMWMLDFTASDALKSYKMSEASGSSMKVKDWEIHANGNKMKPKWIFRPSHTKLLDSWFTLFEFSEYLELDNYIYSHVMAVDDRQDFLNTLSKEFKTIEKFKAKNPKSKEDALETILKENPQVALLDMHLTPKEEFEWLWISNELIRQWYKWKIMIISWYPKEKLQSMRNLMIGQDIHIPWKDIWEIKKCLSGKCVCEK